MKTRSRNKRIIFDLNHPADFHFFKRLMGDLEDRGYKIRVIARDKDCLHTLLRHHGIKFISRGKGRHSITGKYLYAVFNVALLARQLIRFRPALSVSLSSPYLILASRIFSIKTLTYIDTDFNPRIFPFIRRAHYVFTPAGFQHTFHHNHFRLNTMKEMAYLAWDKAVHEKPGVGCFFRITRTDSVHHSPESGLDLTRIVELINNICQKYPCILSSEVPSLPGLSGQIEKANITEVHAQLQSCRVFWGNSATMAAEAALLGVPAIFVGAEKFSYLIELEEYGLLHCFHPSEVDSSVEKLKALLIQQPDRGEYIRALSRFCGGKIDITSFLLWFIENLPLSPNILRENPKIQHQFKL